MSTDHERPGSERMREELVAFYTGQPEIPSSGLPHLYARMDRIRKAQSRRQSRLVASLCAVFILIPTGYMLTLNQSPDGATRKISPVAPVQQSSEFPAKPESVQSHTLTEVGKDTQCGQWIDSRSTRVKYRACVEPLILSSYWYSVMEIWNVGSEPSTVNLYFGEWGLGSNGRWHLLTQGPWLARNVSVPPGKKVFQRGAVGQADRLCSLTQGRQVEGAQEEAWASSPAVPADPRTFVCHHQHPGLWS